MDKIGNHCFAEAGDLDYAGVFHPGTAFIETIISCRAIKLFLIGRIMFHECKKANPAPEWVDGQSFSSTIYIELFFNDAKLPWSKREFNSKRYDVRMD